MENLTTDTLRNFTSGLGDPFRDKAASSHYSSLILSDSQLMASYRNTWIAKKIVNVPALDSLRKGRDWQAEKDQITLIENEEKRLKFWNKLLQCRTLARLWGGAAIYIGSKDNDLSEPFDFERVRKGQLPYITVLSRRELSPSQLEDDPMSEFYGLPSSYQLAGKSEFIDIHPSRMVVQIGDMHPDIWNAPGQTHGWGDSVLQSVFTAMLNSDSTASNIASLVFEANVDVFSIPGMMDSMGNKAYRDKLLDRFTLAAAGKSITKNLILDKDEDYNRKQVSFTSLPDVLQSFLLLVSGAADIPLTRFLGQSPAGLSSTGEGDMKNYYDRITSAQTLEIQPALWKLDEALIRSALGNRPDEIFYQWSPLEQLSEKDQAEIGLKNAQTVEALSRAGLYSQEELRSAHSNQAIETGFYPGLGEIMENDEGPDFDLGEGEGEQTLANDATPRTLYLRRDVLNAKEIIDWYVKQGVPKVYKSESMHVTIIYSKQPLDWMKMGEPWDSQLEIKEGGPRLHEKFGDHEDCLVLCFKSWELDHRHEMAINAGGKSDFPEYQSHITLSIDCGEFDASEIEPWQGKIVLGPETYKEIEQGDWKKRVKTNDEEI